jgi:hypothetical protein
LFSNGQSGADRTKTLRRHKKIILKLTAMKRENMTCYFRHLGPVFEQAGIEVTPENKRDIDKVIHALVGVEYKDCSAAWRAVKEKLAEDEGNFVAALKDAWESGS